MPEIKKGWVDQIIIVDGGSTDGTVEYAKENGYFVFVQKEKGIRNAYTEALEYVNADIIITFSPDGNCIPEAIPILVDKMREGYDMVIASRYAQGARSYDDDILTAFGNWFGTGLLNLLHGSKYTDAMGIFRAYKRSLIQDLDLDKDSSYSTPERILHTVISWEPLLSIRAAKKKLKVTEIPADEPKRIGGKRKLQRFKWSTAYLFQIIREFFIRG
ncbi:MAG: histidinol phosphate phosphatase [Omnitrophica WOR_2 bacterium SM23_29]|nr:MAG: histidinol phosphate phosphatase [Omnitrophica WOR_2 bacterium SM23_29]